MLYNRKAIRTYLRDRAGVQVSSDFWVGLDVSIRRILDIAIRQNRNFKRITSSELGYTSMLMKMQENKQDGEK